MGWVTNFAWVLGRASARRCGALVVRKRCVPLRFGAVCAGVVLEALLSNPVEEVLPMRWRKPSLREGRPIQR